MFKRFIKKIDSGYCDELSIDQLDKLIKGFELISEVEESIKPKTKRCKLFRKI